jgi:hypothetical protein
MRSPTFLIALGMFALAGSSANAQPKGKGGENSGARYGWLSSLSDGKDQARTTGKPMMVVLRCVP